MKNSYNADIFKISNKYLLKTLFGYIDDSIYILKLVKYNKKLQVKLGLNFQNYKDYSDLPKYSFLKKKQIQESYRHHDYSNERLANLFEISLTSCGYCIYFTYLLIYAILLKALDTFDESNTINNYNETSKIIINKLNTFLFILVGWIVVAWALLIFFVYKNCNRDYGIIKIIKTIIIIIIDSINIIYEGLMIWKLVLSYEIKSEKIPWFMIMDYIFIFIHFFHICLLILITYLFFIESGIKINFSEKCVLTSFNNVNIKSYTLPQNFDKWSKKERKRFVADNSKKYRYNTDNRIEYEMNMLLMSINLLRRQYLLPYITIDYRRIIHNFVIKEPSEMLLYQGNKIIKLSNKEYLFKMDINHMLNEITVKNNEILNIIRKNNLNCINYIIMNQNYYIILFEYEYNEYYNSQNDDNDDNSFDRTNAIGIKKIKYKQIEFRNISSKEKVFNE